MKTDSVLTMDEYLNEICAVPKYVSPPASDVRHIPITAEYSPDLGTGEQPGHACRSDRWGHPCPGSVKVPARDRADATGLDGVANKEVNKNGNSNCVRCRIGDGAVRVTHRTMLKRSRMAIAFSTVRVAADQPAVAG